MQWEGDTLLVAGSSRPASVAVTIDGSAYPAARLRFTTSDSQVVAIGADGMTLAARRIGVATITTYLLDATLPVPGPSMSTRLVVSPAGIRLGATPDTLRSLGDTVRLTATAVDASGSAIGGATVAWSSADTLVATVDGAGLVTSRANGTVTVRAAVGSAAATATLVVRQRAAAVRFTPGSLRLDALGADSTIAVVTVDARGVPLGMLAPQVSWTSAQPTVATVVDGRVTAVANGTSWVRATAGPVRDSVAVEVSQRASRVVIETPTPIALRSIGETAIPRARAYDRRDNEVLVATPSWRSLNPLVAHVEPQSGVVTGLAAGSATLVAELDGATASAAVEVSDVPARVLLEPAIGTITSVGDTLPLTWSVRNARGADVQGATVTFATTDSAILRTLGSGHVVAVGTGTARVIAAVSAGVADTAVVSVTNAVAHVAIVPDAVVMASIGDSVTPAASIRNARSAELPRSDASWSSDDVGVARVTSAGVVLATGAGETRIRVASPAYPDKRDSMTVVVTNAAASVVIERDTDVIAAVGASRTYAVEVRNARNALVATAPEWRTLDAAVARVSTTGLVTTVGTGTARIVAAAGAAADTLVVTVRNDVVTVELTPPTATLSSVGEILYPVVTARNALGGSVAGPAVSWASTDTTVLRIVANGGVLGAATGTARVVATSGAAADTMMITVINAVAHVDIVPDLATLASVGDSIIPAASIRNAAGAELTRTAATWSTDDAGVARVTAGGIVIATGAGETIVRATSAQDPSRRDSLTVTVTNAAASVVIERATDVMTTVGESRQYSAEVRNARNALIAALPEWRSLDAAVARVSTTGVATSVGVGTARIVASSGAAADTLVLTVRNDIVAIEVTPSAATLTSLGDVIVPVATARNSIGGVVAAPSLVWAAADTTVARLQPDGSVLAVGVGSTRVTVSAGTVADTMTVTVSNLPVVIDIAGDLDTIPAIGDSVVLAVSARNARGDVLPSTTLAWSVEDPVVARVGSTGSVTARAVGSTWVRATGGSARDSIRIVVTNDPAGIAITLTATGEVAVRDTLTATGQSLAYAATVSNRYGSPITDAAITWRSSDAAVVQASATGVATAVGFGSALLIARAGTVEDTVHLVVADPRRVYVNNAAVTPSRFGTVARPYATIQDGVNAAGVDDTVIVMRGNGYSEAVTLGRRVTVLGDSAAFVSGGRDPLLLPLLRHDLGVAGISATTAGASFTIRYLGIQHSVDGEAIAVRDADNLVLSEVYVNPVPGFRTGRGILVERASGSVSITRSRVDSVYAYGVTVRDAADARIENVTVRSVAARSGFAGTGIELVRSAGIVSGVQVRRTAGPQVTFTATTGASLLASSLTGEQQLVRLDSVRGTTTVSGNTFDLRRQAGEAAPARGGGLPDPSGIEVIASAGVLLNANSFTDIGGQTSLMDGVRLAGVRAAAGGPAFGAQLTANRFDGMRSAVRSTRSTWEMTGSRVDTASVAIVLTESDTVSLSRDTLMHSRVAAVQSTGAGSDIRIVESIVTGAQRALVVTGATRVTMRNNTVTGATLPGLAQPSLGAVDISAGVAEVAGNVITGVRGWTALALRSGTARADSNLISRNLVGVRLGTASAATMAANAIFDNDTLPSSARRSARGAINDGAAILLGDNWWGAPEGPQSDAALSPAARGDSVIGGITAGVLAAPIAMHTGSAAFAGLRKVAGDGQSGVPGLPVAVPLTVRAVDAGGRPLAGVSVQFSVRSSSGDFVTPPGTRTTQGQNTIVTMTTDANGLASAQYVPGAIGAAIITTSAGSGGSQMSFTFTVTGS